MGYRNNQRHKCVQDKRGNNHSQGILVANGSSRRRIKPAENKSQRLLGSDDLPDALKILPFRSEDILGKRKQIQ
ncbi:TPA: hypothetical protein ACHTCC_002502 [Citrobacter freundii]